MPKKLSEYKVEEGVMRERDAKMLAFDVACNYFSDEQLCNRYGLSLKQLTAVREQPSFQALVDENDRLLNDDGSEFLIKAKEYALDALRTLREIMLDSETAASTRKAAAESVLKFAGVSQKKEAGGEAAGPTLVINTNLALNQTPKGTYQVTAKPVNERPVQGQVVNGDEPSLAEIAGDE